MWRPRREGLAGRDNITGKTRRLPLSLLASHEQRKLSHPIIIDCLDRTAKIVFAIAYPRSRAGAIETCHRRTCRSGSFCRLGHEIDTETSTARGSHVPERCSDEVFPNRSGATD